MVVPNVILLALVVLYFVFTRGSGPAVQPLVTTDQRTAAKIERLESRVTREPTKASGSALELSKLYARVGEFPWSVDVLRSAERSGDRAPVWRMKLGLAYLELGKNLDGLRLLKETRQRCDKEPASCTGGGARQAEDLHPGGRVARRATDRRPEEPGRGGQGLRRGAKANPGGSKADVPASQVIGRLCAHDQADGPLIVWHFARLGRADCLIDSGGAQQLGSGTIKENKFESRTPRGGTHASVRGGGAHRIVLHRAPGL